MKRSGLQSAGYKYFIDHLESTLKERTNEISDVIGAAYEKLSIEAAMKLLNLESSNKMAAIVKEVSLES